MKDLKKNDVVISDNWKEAKIICVVKTLSINSKAYLVEIGGLLVTPWHPIKERGAWKFPANIGICKEYDCNAVYNLVLDSQHTVFVN